MSLKQMMAYFTNNDREPLRQTASCQRRTVGPDPTLGACGSGCLHSATSCLCDQSLPSEFQGPRGGHPECTWSSLVSPQICTQRKLHQYVLPDNSKWPPARRGVMWETCGGGWPGAGRVSGVLVVSRL